MRGYVDGRFGQIHYRAIGAGPALLLIHMAPLSGEMWSELAPLLADRYQVIMPDLPGYGLSDRPAAPPSAEDLAGALVDLLDGLGIARSIVVAHHAGAMIGLILATSGPDRVERLVLSCLPYYAPEEAARERELRVPREFAADGSTVQRLWGSTSIEGPLDSDQAIDFTRRMLTAILQAGREWYYLPRAVLGPNSHELLPKLRCPTLLIAPAGDRFSAIQPDLAGLIPNGSHVFAGDRPNVLWREPQRYADPIRAFFG